MMTSLTQERLVRLRFRVDEPPRFKVYNEQNFHRIHALRRLSREQRFTIRVVAQVLPFRVNQHVIDELIDWDNIPGDPIFQLTFPQPGMLTDRHFQRIADLLHRDAADHAIRQAVEDIWTELNPHPARQWDLNMPRLDGERLIGVQHKYRETVLFFPSQGQTCHSYCTFCFRWPQFVGYQPLRFATRETDSLYRYLQAHPEVTDLLVTGGDPLVMRTQLLEGYLKPILAPEFAHIRNIRIGTKALTYWPYRFLTDDDADDLLHLFERLVRAGKHLALMAHYNHWRELDPPVSREAIRRIQATGTVIRTQGPVLAHINDYSDTWARLWQTQVHLGLVPYYMFVERHTGPSGYFEVPLIRTWNIYQGAIRQVSGLSRSAQGPSMSAGPGKVEIQGVIDLHGEKTIVLQFLQGRNPDWVQRPFFARYDTDAMWLDQLRPAFGEREFFYESEYNRMCSARDDNAQS